MSPHHLMDRDPMDHRSLALHPLAPTCLPQQRPSLARSGTPDRLGSTPRSFCRLWSVAWLLKPQGLWVILLAVATLPAAATAGDAPAKTAAVGRKIESFQLADAQGTPYSLADFAEQRLVVVYFLGTECPLAQLYAPRVQQLYEKFRPQGVAVVGVASNVQDSLAELEAYGRRHGLSFPILRDDRNRVADQFGATRTPEVFVLDRDRVIRYQGRIDDEFTFGVGLGLTRPAETRADLAVALDELLAGQEVSVPRTEAKGCLIGRYQEPNESSPVTYSKQISRILQRRCESCHREGQIAPFAMTQYEEVAGWGEMIAEVVREQRMPPWHANPEYGHFANDASLPEEEKELIYEWVRQGCPQGDPADLPPPIAYRQGWYMQQEPDQVFYMADEPTPVKRQGIENYRYFEVDPGFKEDKWVRLAECLPGNPAVVHHIIVFVKPPGTPAIPPGSEDIEIRDMEFLVGFAPGARPLEAPRGWAKRIPAGHTLVFEMHYTPVGTPQEDRSCVGLVYLDPEDVTHVMATGAVINDEFKIAPHDPNYRVDAEYVFPFDVEVLAFFPHMHVRGKAFRYTLQPPNESERIVLDVPRYDFNWQNHYTLAEPLKVKGKSRFVCTAWYDNSEDNLANPDPGRETGWGRQTFDEMMIGFFEFGIPIEQARAMAKRRK